MLDGSRGWPHENGAPLFVIQSILKKVKFILGGFA